MVIIPTKTHLTAWQYDGETAITGMSVDEQQNPVLVRTFASFKVKKGDWVVALPTVPITRFVLTDSEYQILLDIVTNSREINAVQYNTDVSADIADGMQWNPLLGCYEVITSTGSYLVTSSDWVLCVDDAYRHQYEDFKQKFLMVFQNDSYTYLFT